MMPTNGDIFRVAVPLCGEFTGDIFMKALNKTTMYICITNIGMKYMRYVEPDRYKPYFFSISKNLILVLYYEVQ